jgi:hypothetical protein
MGRFSFKECLLQTANIRVCEAPNCVLSFEVALCHLLIFSIKIDEVGCTTQSLNGGGNALIKVIIGREKILGYY